MLVAGACVQAGPVQSTLAGGASPKKKPERPARVRPDDVDGAALFNVVTAGVGAPGKDPRHNMDVFFEGSGGSRPAKEEAPRPAGSVYAWVSPVSAPASGYGCGAGIVEAVDETLISHARLSGDWSVTECGGDRAARRASSESEPVVFTFEVFRQAWLEIRLEIIEFYEALTSFREYFKQVCALPGGQDALIAQCNCNVIAPDGSPVGPAAFKPFESLCDIKDQYEYVRGKYHRVLCLAAVLKMGKCAIPRAVECDPRCLALLNFLTRPLCRLCPGCVKGRDGNELHPNFTDQKQTTFNDVCSRCRKSFLRKLFDANSAQVLALIQETLGLLKEANDGIACLLPRNV